MRNLLFLFLLTISTFSCRKSAIVDGTPWEGCLTNYYNNSRANADKFDEIYLDEDLPWVQSQDAMFELSYALEGQQNSRATFKYHDVYKRVTLPSGREQFIVTVAGVKKSFCKIYNEGLYTLEQDYNTLDYYGDDSSVDSIVLRRANDNVLYSNISFALETHPQDAERNLIKLSYNVTIRTAVS